jgi:2'-5' RNA ligase
MNDQIRTFIAMEIPRSVKKTLSTYIRDISGGSWDYKWVSRDNLHITIAFLGVTTYDDIHHINSALERAATLHTPFQARLGKIGTFGSVIWVGLSEGDEECSEIYQVLKTELLMANFRLDDRRFHPHITLARSRRRMTPEEKKAFETNEPPEPLEFSIQGVTLFESKLNPKGPEYIPLKKVVFGEK